jgi:hypothetical protein
MGYAHQKPTRTLEKLSDPLGGLLREETSAAKVTVAKGVSVSAAKAEAIPPRGTRISRVKKPVDHDHEKRLHEELMAERRSGSEGFKVLFALAAAAALAMRSWLDLDLKMTLEALAYAIPVIAIFGLILYQARHILPAFSDSGAGMVVVALVVGIGCFYLFFADGHMSRLKRDANERRPTASPVIPH